MGFELCWNQHFFLQNFAKKEKKNLEESSIADFLEI
jgi:hypothetical protein